MARHIVWRRCLLWNDIAHSASTVSTQSSSHLAEEKGVHYRSGKRSPLVLLLRPLNEGQWSRIYVLICVWGVGGKRGVQHWGMCTCNFSHLTQLVFCKVSGLREMSVKVMAFAPSQKKISSMWHSPISGQKRMFQEKGWVTFFLND